MSQNNPEQNKESKPQGEFKEKEYRNYRDLVAWQKAHALALKIYDLTTMYPKDEILGLTAQTKQIAGIIPALLVEGYVCNIRDKYIMCLDEALSKLAHLEYFLLLAKDLRHLPRNFYEEAEKLRQDVTFLYVRLLDSIKRKKPYY